jgi:hypothetical protein
VEQYRVFWNTKLDALEDFMASDIANNIKPIKKPKKI